MPKFTFLRPAGYTLTPLIVVLRMHHAITPFTLYHAADFSHAEFEAGLVAAEIIADQLALPVLQEITRMFAGPAHNGLVA